MEPRILPPKPEDFYNLLQLGPKLSVGYGHGGAAEFPQVTHRLLGVLCLTLDETNVFLEFYNLASHERAKTISLSCQSPLVEYPIGTRSQPASATPLQANALRRLSHQRHEEIHHRQ